MVDMNRKDLKFVVGVLTSNRNVLLEKTLNSFMTYNSMVSNFVLVDSDSSEKAQENNRVIAKKFGMRYVLNEQSFADDRNIRIEHGVGRLIKEILKESADLYCLLQDDWQCLGTIPIASVWKFLSYYKNIGQVRMRDFKYDDTFDGGSSINFVTHRKIEFTEEIVIENSIFKIGELHWVDSCNLMLRQTLLKVSKMFESECDRMNFFHLIHPYNAQLQPGLFHHVGPRRIRYDLRERGFFSSENFS